MKTDKERFLKGVGYVLPCGQIRYYLFSCFINRLIGFCLNGKLSCGRLKISRSQTGCRS